MKDNKGITMVVLVITIVILLIIAGISIFHGNKAIKSSQLENVKTNMLLIKVKAKEYTENANFKLGTNFESATDKDTKVANAKTELKGEEIKNSSMFGSGMNITQEQLTSDNTKYIYYYRLNTTNLKDMGFSKLESDESNGWYIIKYDIKNLEVEIYSTRGFKKDGVMYYSLTDLENID